MMLALKNPTVYLTPDTCFLLIDSQTIIFLTDGFFATDRGGRIDLESRIKHSDISDIFSHYL